MKAINRRFTEIINGNRQFIIPVFQRDYSWTTEQCGEMWKAILSASEGDEDGGHFLGSIVYVATDAVGAAFQSWLVIDGQQRLATLTLLLTALRDCIADSCWSGDDDSPTTERIDAYFLKNVLESGHRSYKLLLRRADDATLKALVDGGDLSDLGHEASEPIRDAYDYFLDLLKTPGSDFDKVYRGIGRLNIVEVTLERRIDNPQLVFESMNSTGVDLSQSDLVRNYLLMGLDESEQTRLYDRYWSKIESFFRASRDAFDWFLRDYIALQTKSNQQTRLDRIYDAFKDFWRPGGDTPLDAMLEDMSRVSRTYASFLGIAPMERPWLADSMGNMRSLNTTQGLVIMRLYDCHQRGLLSKDEFVRAIRLIESYLLRRAVLGLQTRAYWTLFARVAHEIDSDNALNSLQVALARLRDNNRFPTDVEFSRALREIDLYELRICKHVLDGIENADQKEPSPVHKYSIEHILPQNIDDVPEWQKMLGDEWRDVHDMWLHRLGNLTLTAYNATYSNRPFQTKKEVTGGFRQSAIRLNQYVREHEQWAQVEIQERGDLLAKRALEIWPYHSVNEAHIQAADVQDLQNRAAQRSVDDLEVASDVHTLLSAMLERVRELGEVIEVIEHKSVCFYCPGFFAELLPMGSRLRVLLPLDFNEAENPAGISIEDASTWRFVPNRMHGECNLLVDITQRQQVAEVIPMMRQALDQSQKTGYR